MYKELAEVAEMYSNSDKRLRLPRIDRKSVTHKVHSIVRDYVLSGKIQPGVRLIESQLAEQLGVSRAPVREALLALESEGLVFSIPSKGTFVVELTEEDLTEIYELRSVLEGLAIRLAAEKHGKESFMELSDIVERMEQAAREEDSERVAALDLEFHRAIWKLSGHKRLCQLLTDMMSQIRTFVALNTKLYERLTDNCLEHVTLLETLRSGNVQRAERLMVDHIVEAGKVNASYLRTAKERAPIS